MSESQVILDRAAVEQALALARAHERLAQEHVAMLERLLDGTPDADPLIPVKVAAGMWQVSYDTALRRARRGAGVKAHGRWYFRQSDVKLRRHFPIGG